MSRVGRAPVYLKDNVEVEIKADNTVIVKGAKDTLEVPMRPEIQAKVEDGRVVFTRSNDEPATRSFHGLYRALVQNAVTGLSTGWTRQLELNGVGYRAQVKGKTLELNLGYSHPIEFPIPEGIEVKVDKQTTVVVSGPSREKVGQVAAKIRGLRPPEPFLGKGIRYSDETIQRKSGKSAKK